MDDINYTSNMTLLISIIELLKSNTVARVFSVSLPIIRSDRALLSVLVYSTVSRVILITLELLQFGKVTSI